MKKQLSIIIPAYNAADYIERAIMSTEIYYNPDCEIIVVDDGSTDNTVSICNKFEKYENFKIIQHEKNKGVSAARNTGIKESIAPYIAFLDSDDELSNGTIKKWINDIQMCKCDLYIWGCEETNKHNTRRYNVTADHLFSRTAFVNRMFYYDLKRQIRYGVIWGKIYKKEIIEENACVFIEDMKLGEDTFFNIDYYGYLNNAYVHKDISYRHILRKGSLSQQHYSDYSLLYKKTLDKYAELFSRNGKSRVAAFVLKKRFEGIKRILVYKISDRKILHFVKSKKE